MDYKCKIIFISVTPLTELNNATWWDHVTTMKHASVLCIIVYYYIFLSSKQSAVYTAQYAVDNIPLFWTQPFKMHEEEFKPLQIVL